MTDDFTTRVEALSQNLDPGFTERAQSWERYGLPASSIPEGSRSTEQPIPVNQHGTIPDLFDRQIRRDRRQVERLESQVVESLLKIDAIQQTYRALPHDEASKLAAELISPKAKNCANENCQRVVECTPNDRLRSGRCMPCYQWFQSHGFERPKERTEAWIEKEAARLSRRGIDPRR